MTNKINSIDDEIMRLFAERMELCAESARERVSAGQTPTDMIGERDKEKHLRTVAGEKLSGYASTLYSTVFELGRAYQGAVVKSGTPLCDKISASIKETPQLFPESAVVACQGTEGAYSQIAAEKIFEHPDIVYFKTFEGAVSAVEKGLCSYAVLPLENSTAGSVNAVYDLMMQHHFSIVRSARLKVDHCLLAKPGTKLSDVKEVYSHEQALHQCAEYLKGLPGVKITDCENTAAAARMIAESDRTDVAALSSRSCAELYGLEILAEAVQDKQNNYTRFICVSKNLEIYPGADHTSLMLTTPNRPGSLYRVMARINALNINLTKLESRPLPEHEFDFMFYFDLDTPVYSPRFSQLIGELEGMCETFQYFGSYSEIV